MTMLDSDVIVAGMAKMTNSCKNLPASGYMKICSQCIESSFLKLILFIFGNVM
jgi:hypothetical protein